MISVRQWVRGSARFAADLILPPVCLACRRPLASHDALCAGCWSGVKFIRPPLCDRLGIPLPFDTGGPAISALAAADPPAYDRARAVGHFEGVLRDLVHQFKYGDSHIARRLFGRWLVSAGRELLADAEIIVPVPLNRWRLLGRRFNQAAVLARELSAASGVGWDPLALARTRRTSSQVGLTRDQRKRNVRAAFEVPAGRQRLVEGRRVIVLDDVITTGATVEACALALRRAGAERVDVLALGLVTPDSQINP